MVISQYLVIKEYFTCVNGLLNFENIIVYGVSARKERFSVSLMKQKRLEEDST